MDKQRFKRLQRAVCLGASILICVFGLVIVVCGRGGEAQFSPDSFQNREVIYYYIPYTDIMILAIKGEPRQLLICQYWLEHNYIKLPPDRESLRWDVITGWWFWDRSSYSGPAKAFWYHANCYTEEEMREWIKWSRHHPKFADKLWPKVTQLIRRGDLAGYGSAAMLMSIVNKPENEEEFSKLYTRWREQYGEDLP